MNENNKLIAEFMGAAFWKHPKEGEIVNLPHKIPGYTISELKYHESWDWLIPVLEAIERTGATTTIQNDKATIAFTQKIIATKTVGNKLGNVYNAVIEFIKWYNLQTLPTKCHE